MSCDHDSAASQESNKQLSCTFHCTVTVTESSFRLKETPTLNLNVFKHPHGISVGFTRLYRGSPQLLLPLDIPSSINNQRLFEDELLLLRVSWSVNVCTRLLIQDLDSL